MKTRTKIFITAFYFRYAATCQTLPQALAKKINTEGFQKSQVMDLRDLSDVYGPRLTGTNHYFTAAEWAKKPW
jgi:hypothetical protein